MVDTVRAGSGRLGTFFVWLTVVPNERPRTQDSFPRKSEVEITGSIARVHAQWRCRRTPDEPDRASDILVRISLSTRASWEAHEDEVGVDMFEIEQARALPADRGADVLFEDSLDANSDGSDVLDD